MKSFSNYNKPFFLGFVFVLMSIGVCFAQIEFTEHEIEGGGRSVFAVDIDSDGDMDVLDGWPITWWEN
ncbi:MAG: hypothetical protein HQ568_04160, partial [Calditrichaeota bacterium]|nr:hypothetical protein [Calditrichota bacterium]